MPSQRKPKSEPTGTPVKDTPAASLRNISELPCKREPEKNLDPYGNPTKCNTSRDLRASWFGDHTGS